MSTFDYLKEIVAFDTTSSDNKERDRSNKSMLEHMARHFYNCNFTTIMYEVIPGKFNLIAISPVFNSRYLNFLNLNASEGKTGRDYNLGLMLAGHSDTVPFDNSKWTTSATDLTLRDGKAYGRGACDMKAYLACMMELANQISDQHLDNFNAYPKLTFMVTCDEECSMIGAIDGQRLATEELTAENFKNLTINIPDGVEHTESALQSFFLNKKFDLIIIGEPTLMQAVVAHKGYVARELIIDGVSAHSSNPALGINALKFSQVALQRLSAFEEELKEISKDENFKVPYATLNLGYCHGGHSLNSICDEIKIGFDLRPTPTIEIKKVVADVDKIVEELNQRALETFKQELTTERVQQRLKDTTKLVSYAIPFDDIPAFANTDEQSLNILKRNAEPGLTFEYVNYCTEASFLQTFGPTVVMGPGSIDQAHGIDEYVELTELAKCDEFLGRLVCEFRP